MHSAKGEWEDGDRLERIMKVLTDPLEVSGLHVMRCFVT